MSNSLLIMVSLAVASIGLITWQHSVRSDLMRARRRWLQASLLLAAGMLVEGYVEPGKGEMLRLALGSGMSNAGIALQLTIIARVTGLKPPNWLWLAFGAVSALDKLLPYPPLMLALESAEIPILYLAAAWLYQRAERLVSRNRFSPTALLFLLGALLFIWRDASDFYLRLQATPIQPDNLDQLHQLALAFAAAAQVCGAVGFLNIVLQRQHNRLEDAANLDPLTGAGNRRALQYWLRTLEASVERVCVVMLDIDHFKSVNDRYGHPAGDAVLQALAMVLRSGIRDNDMLIRYGGEEFCLLMPDADIDDAVQAAERLLQAFRQLAPLPGHPELRCTFSAGAHEWDCRRQDFADAQQKADQALYLAKQDGRDRVRRH
ncbi:GGDEF domain protein [Chromobacterium violaceum]|uniref:GGDEF domain-containing protein n=1 Tax=Chromobacterium violaceum TaxID=536 RepID=UPI001B323F4F|nr:GGDEF domain-containing protein [Chromobacterium violaceum]MBP4047670.1 GGDEF domain-containing protein [Chromobacterium violaceum]